MTPVWILLVLLLSSSVESVAMPSITDLPIEIFLDNLLPILPVSDLAHLAETCKFFALLASDGTFWKLRCQSDFNFSGAGTARTSGWKFIYSRLSKPRVFVWGAKSHGRLGLSTLPKTSLNDVPFPTELKIPGARIVSLVAAGMSFHALDSKGDVFVWGTLDGLHRALTSDGFSEAGKQAGRPLRLQLPVSMRSISCGRLHAASLDSQGYVWNFLSWGRPFRLTSLRLTTFDSLLIQVECGWNFSSALTKTGDIFVWWPFSGSMERQIEERNSVMNNAGDKKAHVSSDGVITCVPWDLDIDPVALPSLPPLPALNTSPEGDVDETIRVIQIASYDGHLIALTTKGHVLKFGCLEDETTVTRGRWEYLPRYSEVESVRQHATFSSAGGSVEPPATMKITHISAHFKQFIAYSTGSSSIVLMGDINTTPDSEPQITPALQNKSVISVVLGDYHQAAVTAAGKLLTWGGYSDGALGLGDPCKLEAGCPGAFQTENARRMALDRGRGTPAAVQVPIEVRFDHGRKKPKDRFCLSAAASGWHSGALVIDLEENIDNADSDVEKDEPLRQPLAPARQFPTRPIIPRDPGDPFIARGNPFVRIGFAGRGMNRGGLGHG